MRSTPTGASLICLPYAGAGASIYREWQARSGSVKLIPLQLAGREQRIREPLAVSVDACTRDLLPQALRLLSGATEASLFGHSLGGVLAYELARALIGARIRVRRLFVSGCPGPSTPRLQKAAGLSDAQFLERVSEFAGYRHSALDDPSLRPLLLPILRADVMMHESYFRDRAEPIDAPITAIRGTRDTLVRAADLDSWREATTSTYESVGLPGGHMYFAEDPEPLLELFASQISNRVIETA